MGVLSRATALPQKTGANNERQVSMAFFSPASCSCTNNWKCRRTREPRHPAPFPQQLNPHTQQSHISGCKRFAARRN